MVYHVVRPLCVAGVGPWAHAALLIEKRHRGFRGQHRHRRVPGRRCQRNPHGCLRHVGGLQGNEGGVGIGRPSHGPLLVASRRGARSLPVGRNRSYIGRNESYAQACLKMRVEPARPAAPTLPDAERTRNHSHRPMTRGVTRSAPQERPVSPTRPTYSGLLGDLARTLQR